MISLVDQVMLRCRLWQRYAREEGRWVTIGGRPEGDKKHVGGTPVKIDAQGRILKGPASLQGQDLDALSDAGSRGPEKDSADAFQGVKRSSRRAQIIAHLLSKGELAYLRNRNQWALGPLTGHTADEVVKAAIQHQLIQDQTPRERLLKTRENWEHIQRSYRAAGVDIPEATRTRWEERIARAEEEVRTSERFLPGPGQPGRKEKIEPPPPSPPLPASQSLTPPRTPAPTPSPPSSAPQSEEPPFRLKSEVHRDAGPRPVQKRLFDLLREDSPAGQTLARAHPVAAAIARGQGPHRLKNDGTDTPPPGVHVTPQGAWTGPVTLHADDIQADPERFQYKVVGIGEKGVTEELADVKQFNPLYGGQILVWRDPRDGKTYVINGHHRLELAQRSPHYTDPVTGLTWRGEMQAYYVPATSAQEARALGALANIAEGRGTATDAAKFLRETGKSVEEIARTGISLRGKIAADAEHLTDLSDQAFHQLATGRIDEGRALAVARHLKDHDLQNQLLQRLAQKDREGRPVPDAHVAEMAREMALAGKTEGGGRSLFGEDFFGPESLIDQRAELKAYLRQALSHEATTFKAVSASRRVARIQEAGNILDVEGNRQRAQAAEQARQLFDKLANYKGPVSDRIQQAAKELKNEPRRKREIAERLRRDVLELFQQHWHQAAGFESGEAERGAVEPYRRDRQAIASGRRAGARHRQPGTFDQNDRQRLILGLMVALRCQWSDPIRSSGAGVRHDSRIQKKAIVSRKKG